MNKIYVMKSEKYGRKLNNLMELSKFPIPQVSTGLIQHINLMQSKKQNKKIKSIRNILRNIEEDEVSTFSPLNVKIYKEDLNEREDNKTTIPKNSFTSFCQDFNRKRNKAKAELNEEGESDSSKNKQSDQVQSSDLVSD